MNHPTKQRLLDAGMAMLLEQGYHDMGIQPLLKATGTPRGSFYHHFEDKEDFALQAIDQYMCAVHATLDECLGNDALEPLRRVRRFFEMVQESYRDEGYLGCLLGGLGQELSGISDVSGSASRQSIASNASTSSSVVAYDVTSRIISSSPCSRQVWN